MLKKENIFWFPIGKSLALAQLQEPSSTQEQFSEIFNRIKSLTDNGSAIIANGGSGNK
jgi:hypothetical protein